MLLHQILSKVVNFACNVPSSFLQFSTMLTNSVMRWSTDLCVLPHDRETRLLIKAIRPTGQDRWETLNDTANSEVTLSIQPTKTRDLKQSPEVRRQRGSLSQKLRPCCLRWQNSDIFATFVGCCWSGSRKAWTRNFERSGVGFDSREVQLNRSLYLETS